MGKNRKSKRQLIRDEKRAKKRGRELAEDEERSVKRQRQHDADDHQQLSNNDLFTLDPNADYIPFDDEYDGNNNNYNDNAAAHNASAAHPRARGGNFEREFFGMLGEQEQEYFRHADELLELNDFPSPEDRHIFLQSVYREARGKELKLASSQSCSRLMERLILLSNSRQKKSLFGAFAGHFMTLVTHRFASHCCEKLFLVSAPVVTAELSGEADNDVEMADAGDDDDAQVAPEVAEAMKTSMEDLFMLTLDELEEHLSFLLSDRYGSHALRVLLVVLSGRPLAQAGTKSLLQGKSKEYVTVEGAAAATSALNSEARPVPSSFSMAIQKIMSDSTASLDSTALRVLAKHPTGNPTLQLLLELELSSKSKKSKKEDGDKAAEGDGGGNAVSLLERLVPDAPASFGDEKSQACEFVNGMLYDPIGSRLLETLIAHCPGKIFKGLQANIFGPRIQSLLRNDIASYPAIKVLNRLSKEDLANAVQKSLPEIPSFVEKGRFNAIKTLFERCNARGATAELGNLLQALTTACGGNWKHIIPKLCLLSEPEPEPDSKEKKFQTPEAKSKTAILSHGSQVASSLLAIPGQPSKAIQNSLLAVSPDQLLRMATTSPFTAAILTKALTTAPEIPHFHKLLVASLLPNIYAVATSQHGNAIVTEIISTPSKGSGAVVPFHLKENIMTQLERHERALRETWLGRNVWRAWRGDLWSHRRHDWVRWAKETDPEGERVAGMPRVNQQDKNGDEEGKKGKWKGKDVKAEKGAVAGSVKSTGANGVAVGKGVEPKLEPGPEMESKAEAGVEKKKKKEKKEKKGEKEKKEKKDKEVINGEDSEGAAKKEKKKKKKKKKTEEDGVNQEVEAA
ncbi:armadillo-type protein [Corynascus novoguineensis]|uniref:Nucleolar protein 9 n=1 Tax=Corynascus novoguineensis TaxID=1126955 RepID=A0AAN7CZT1_9PEZI|nr:armadillo-type protein [Corynascus novoguineensis]